MQLYMYNYICVCVCVYIHYIFVYICTHTHTTLYESVAFCGHLGKPLDVLNNTALTWVYKYLLIPFPLILLGKYPKVELLNHMAILNFLRSNHNINI